MELKPFLKHFGIFFLLLSVISLITFYYLGQPFIGIDDANIFFTYARHMADGYGFVFNIQGERVEGFTSLLWTLICSVFFLVSQRPEKMIMFFSLLLTSFVVTLVYGEVLAEVKRYGVQLLNKFFIFLFAGFIIAISPGFITWNVLSLMDNSLWTFLFVFMVILLLQNNRQQFTVQKKMLLIVLGFLLVLTRPESLGWGLLFTLLLALTEWNRHRNLSFPLIFFGVFCLAGISLYFFRVDYFGYPLPNTYYAKVSSDRLYNLLEGGKYAFSFIIGYHPVITFSILTLSIASLSWIMAEARSNGNRQTNHYRQVPGYVIVTVIIVTAICLPVLTGGDHFGGFRFYQPILLLSVWGLPALLHLYRLNRMALQKRVVVFATIIILFFCAMAVDNMVNLKSPAKRQLAIEFSLAEEGRNIAKTLNNYLPVKPSVGMIAVGGFAFEYNGKTVDLMGLNNTLMAHSSGDRKGFKNHAAFNKDVFYKLKADLLLPKQVKFYKEASDFYKEVRNEAGFYNKAMKNIFNDSIFTKSYLPVVLSKNNKKIFCFARRDFLSRLTRFPQLSVVAIN
jgi:arabinofuranosyltransferase